MPSLGLLPGVWVAPSCFAVLLLELVLRRWRCVFQGPWCRRATLFTLGAMFKGLPTVAFLFLPKGSGPLWPPGQAVPDLVWAPCLWPVGVLHSFGVRGGRSTGLEILVLKQLPLLPLTFSPFENKRKLSNTYWIFYFVLNMAEPGLVGTGCDVRIALCFPKPLRSLGIAFPFERKGEAE